MKAQFVMDDKGRKTAVLLSIKDYKKMLEMLEDYEDIKACNEVRERIQNGTAELISLDEVKKKMASE